MHSEWIFNQIENLGIKKKINLLDFASGNGRNCIPLSNKNIIVTRTFSKIYGLASLRLGWCYAHSNIISSMNKVRGPFNVNQLAQVAGIQALKDKKYIRNSKKQAFFCAKNILWSE